MSLFAEFKQRKLFRIVAAYAAAGWVVLSGVDQLVDREVLPDVVYRIALVWYLGGLVAAAIIGWYHGEKGRQKATTNEIALLVGLTVAVLMASGAIYERSSGPGAGALAEVDGEFPLRRVAVRYFEDRSGDGDLEFVADGLTESLISALDQVQGLDVVSATGSARFRGTDAPTDSVGRALGAGTVVEGQVRPEGERIRVDVFVKDGMTGREFRSASFQRPRDQVFGLQEGLADEASLLLRELLGEEIEVRRVSGATENATAWTAYQRGEGYAKQVEEAWEHGDMEAFFMDASRADSLFALASALDADWPDPWVARAQLQVRLTQAQAGDPLEAGRAIDQGLSHTEMALSLDPQHAGALERRGVLQYFRWALALETDPARADALFESAEADLKEAVRIDPGRANAWVALSVLNAQKPDPVESKIAARRAYEADAFLRSADRIIWTLYTTSYDLEQFPDAVSYCDEGRHRFPDLPEFRECRLWLMASRAVPNPDPANAWAVRDTVVSMTAPGDRPLTDIQTRILLSGVLDRAGLPDSARAVLAATPYNPEVDPAGETLYLEAVFRLQRGDRDEALSLLRRYLTSNPEHREGWQWSSHWWWRPVVGDPEFQALMGGS